jgi:hypothetical protein
MMRMKIEVKIRETQHEYKYKKMGIADLDMDMVASPPYQEFGPLMSLLISAAYADLKNKLANLDDEDNDAD